MLDKLNKKSNAYAFLFMAAVCFACAIIVSSAATGLRGFQLENQQVDIQRNILQVLGLIEEDEKLSNDQVKQRYVDNVKCLILSPAGEVIEDDADPTSVDLDELTRIEREIQTTKFRIQQIGQTEGQQGVVRTMQESVEVLENQLQFPLFVTPREEPYEAYCVPVAGKGLWSTLYGYFALEADANTVRGITFYQHGETPGLGGEVDNPDWKRQFVGKKILDEQDEFVSIDVMKGAAPPDDPHAVDGLSGATITARGVETLLRSDLERYRPYFERIWERKGN